MARPQKEGIDYFPIDCQFSDEVKLIQAEFGLIGLGILIRLWQKIYGGKGFYTKWDDDVALVFASECGVGVSVVKEVVSACLRRGIFNRQKHDQYKVLTSEGIQERYAEATDRRTSQKIDGRYLLIDTPKNWVIADNNSINVDNNSENDDDNPQSKVNKSKVNKSIFTTTTTACAKKSDQEEAPTVAEIYLYFKIEHGLTDSSDQANLFEAYNTKRGWDCLPDWKSAADLWVARINNLK
jgi:hypothetical protein